MKTPIQQLIDSKWIADESMRPETYPIYIEHPMKYHMRGDRKRTAIEIPRVRDDVPVLDGIKEFVIKSKANYADWTGYHIETCHLNVIQFQVNGYPFQVAGFVSENDMTSSLVYDQASAHRN